MREVAEHSGVALGTLYRYFPSKIHLLVAVMEDQLGQLHETLRTRPPAAAAPGERVADTLLRAFRALQREPLLADAMVRALIFADRSVRAEVDTVSRLTTTIIVDAMAPARRALRPFRPPARRRPGDRAHLARRPGQLALRPRQRRAAHGRHPHRVHAADRGGRDVTAVAAAASDGGPAGAHIRRPRACRRGTQ